MPRSREQESGGLVRRGRGSYAPDAAAASAAPAAKRAAASPTACTPCSEDESTPKRPRPETSDGASAAPDAAPLPADDATAPQDAPAPTPPRSAHAPTDEPTQPPAASPPTLQGGE